MSRPVSSEFPAFAAIELKARTTIEYWDIARLVPYARNPRKNDAAVDRMAASIQQFGLKMPCLARSDGEVVDGHLRLKAARKLGITEIPVILCDEWTPVQVKAFRLMVNRSVGWAEWDEELVGLELGGVSRLVEGAGDERRIHLTLLSPSSPRNFRDPGWPPGSTAPGDHQCAENASQ